MHDLVSIVVPIYNAEQYLGKCIESLLGQTYGNIEILLVDDCSTDQSAAIAKSYADANPDICKFIPCAQNSGVSYVRNLGIDLSAGQWLAFVDSDDWVSPDYVSRMYQIALEDCADIVMSGCTYVWDDGREEKMPALPITTASGHLEKVAFCRCCMTAKLIRKQVLLDTGIRLPENIKRLEELSVIAPLCTYTEKISITDQSLYYYLQRESSSSHQNTKKTDIEVFWNSVERMFQLSAPGYEREMEYHAICELLYGATMIMLRGGRKHREVVAHINRFLQRFPDWETNPYLSGALLGKRIFMWFAARKQCGILKMLILAWDTKQKFR